MDGDSIRKEFLKFFEGKGHEVMPSSSLVPAGRPYSSIHQRRHGPLQALLYRRGHTSLSTTHSCQKSFRTTDIDEVGDHKHLTFFEMLGNFSIGDYFKKEAIGVRLGVRNSELRPVHLSASTSPSSRTTTRPFASGTRTSVYTRSASTATTRRTTGGAPQGRRAPAVPAARSTTTVV